MFSLSQNDPPQTNRVHLVAMTIQRSNAIRDRTMELWRHEGQADRDFM